MAIPHLQRVDAVLHDLAGYALDSAKEVLHVGADVAETVVELEEEDLHAIEAATTQFSERLGAEWDATVVPLFGRMDDAAIRVDAADAYARSVSPTYAQARAGAPGLGEARTSGERRGTDAPLEDLVSQMEALAAQAERLRDQVTQNARLPRLLQDRSLATALADVVEQAKDCYLCTGDDLIRRERERLVARLERACAPRSNAQEVERIQAAGARKQHRIADGAREGFARILSPRDVDLLDELANLSVEGVADPGARTSDFLLLGWLVHELPEGPFTPEFTDDTPVLLDIPRAFRACYGDRLDDGRLIVPQLVDRSDNCSVAVAGNRADALPAISALAALELAGTRAGCQRFVVIDCSPGHLGLAQWLPFVESCPQLLDEPLLSSLDEAAPVLQRLAERAVCATYDSALDLAERTAAEDGSHAPLTTVIAINVPRLLDEAHIAPLVNIAQHGMHAGVNLIVSTLPADDRDRRRGLYDLLQSMPEESLVIDCPDGDSYAVWGNRLVLEPTDWSVLGRVREGLERAERAAELRYRGIAGLVPAEEVGRGDASEALRVPFGLAPDGSAVALELGDAVAAGLSHFALVTGTTGTGKSSLLHTLILSALSRYAPSELELYLLDFKQGVEFEVYRSYRLPQVRVVALDADQAFGVSVLEALDAELRRRAQLYQDLGVTSYAAARRATAEPLPRVLVILDEFQVLLNEATDRRAANRAAQIMRTFFQTARAFGMHFVMATQALSSLGAGCSMGLSDLSQVNVRIGLNNSEAEHTRLFGERAARDARRLIGDAKGSGAYLVDKDAAEPDVRAFRVCYCDDAEKDRVLSEVQARCASVAAEPTFVYRGTDVPRLSASPAFSAPGGAPAERGPHLIHLGESARMGRQAALELSRMRRSTLFALTSDVETCDRLAATYVAGAAWDAPAAGAPSVYVLDAHVIGGDGAAPAVEAVCRWAGGRARVARSATEAVALLDELAGLLEGRGQDGAGEDRTAHLVLVDHQLSEPLSALVEGRELAPWRADDAPAPASAPGPEPVRPDAGEVPGVEGLDALLARLDALSAGADAPAEPAAPAAAQDAPAPPRAGRDLLARLLDAGHARGVNVALFSSDYLIVRDLRYEVLPKMAWRVVSGLSDDQCHAVVPDVNPAALRSNTAVLWDGAHPALAFKPYRIDAESLPALP